MSNPLRQYLVKNGVLSDADFTKAEQMAAKEKISVTFAIEKLGTVDENALLEALSKMFRVPKTALQDMDIPTAIIANPMFRRMTPPTIWSWVFWIVPAVFFGPLVASYVVKGPWRRCSLLEGKTLAGGFLSVLAVGCPICNKVVVALLGISGALSYFAPIQPVLGTMSVALLAYGVRLRFRPSVRGGLPS